MEYKSYDNLSSTILYYNIFSYDCNFIQMSKLVGHCEDVSEPLASLSDSGCKTL